tara:strand:+ start:817 stop:2457 length:1641 start_codon:yes stop_codon:yes gene_type:complete
MESTKISISNKFRNLEIVKRNRKRKETDKPDDVDIEKKPNSEIDGLFGAEQPVEAPSSGSSGCAAASKNWCSKPTGSGPTGAVCLAGTPYSPISCSKITQSSYEDYNPSYTSYTDYRRITASYIPNGISGTFSFYNDNDEDSSDILPTTPQWQSVSIAPIFEINFPTFVYYRQIPGGDTSGNTNGEWFIDQWLSDAVNSPSTSCFCTTPDELNVGSSGETSGTVSKCEYPCYKYKNDGFYTSFYMTFDGTYFSIFFSDGNVFSFDTDQKNAVIGPNTFSITMPSSNAEDASYTIGPSNYCTSDYQFNDICSIGANPNYPIPCSADITLTEDDIKFAGLFGETGATAYGETGATAYEFTLNVFKNDSYSDTVTETVSSMWKSGKVNLLTESTNDATTYVYYRDTGSTSENGQWFLDQWTTDEVPSSCICSTKPQSLESLFPPNTNVDVNENSYSYEAVQGALSFPYQFYYTESGSSGESDASGGTKTSFYVSFDGIDCSIFYSNGKVDTYRQDRSNISLGTEYKLSLSFFQKTSPSSVTYTLSSNDS